MNAPNYKVRILFEDASIPEMNKNIMLSPGNEVSYAIKRNNKGEFVLRYISEAPITTTSNVPASNQDVVTYSATPRVNTNVSVTETNTITTNTTTTNVPTTTTEGVNMNISITENGMGMNMGVNINEMNSNTNMNVNGVTSTTTTTTITTTESDIDVNENTVQSSNTNNGCSAPMNSSDYSSAKNSIASKSFSESKMTMAQQITKSNCLTSDQIKGIIETFDFEEDRLNYAKFAYPYCFDKNNYYKVNDTFDFESSIEELDQAIGR